MTVKGSYNEFFPSRWLKAADIPGGEDLVLTIRDVNNEPVGEDQELKLVLSFEEVDKELCLNKTNAGTLEKLFGHDPNAAIGKRVALGLSEATYMGKTSLVVRIRLTPPPQKTPSPTSPSAAMPRSMVSEKQAMQELGFDGPPEPEFPF